MSMDLHKRAPQGYSLSLYQTPDAEVDSQGRPLRPECRYAPDDDGETPYDSPQQDACFVMEGAPDLDDKKINGMFLGAANRLRQDPADRFRSSGTTATLTHLDTNGVLTIAYAGDSPVNIYVRDKATGALVQTGKLTEDHGAQNASEVTRVQSAGAFISADGRLNGTLMLTRALGDTDARGLSDEPEIHRYDLSAHLQSGRYEVIVVTETDGAMEREGLWPEQAEAQRQTYIASMESGGHYGGILARLAEHGGATDNVTSCALVLDRIPDHNVTVCMFDGHGSNGGAASDIVAASFEDKLNVLKRDYDQRTRLDATRQYAFTPPGYTDGYDDANAMRIIQATKDIWRTVQDPASTGQQYPRSIYHGFTDVLDTEEDRAALKSALAAQEISFREEKTTAFGGQSILVLDDDDSMDALERVLEGWPKAIVPTEPAPVTEPMTDCEDDKNNEPIPETKRGFHQDRGVNQDDGIYGAYKSYIGYDDSDEVPPAPVGQRFGAGIVLSEVFSQNSTQTSASPRPAAEERKITPQPCIPIGKPAKPK